MPSNDLEKLFDRVSPQEAAQRVTQCGLGKVTVRYDELLQAEVLIAERATAVTDEQLTCADKAASYYRLELPTAVQTRYDAIREARLSAHFLREAQNWLADRGLLDQVPKYAAGIADDAVFTRKLEDLCGPKAKGAFQSEYGFHALSPDWVQRNLQPPFENVEVLTCLTNAALVAGFDIGFIGNEAFRKED